MGIGFNRFFGYVKRIYNIAKTIPFEDSIIQWLVGLHDGVSVADKRAIVQPIPEVVGVNCPLFNGETQFMTMPSLPTRDVLEYKAWVEFVPGVDGTVFFGGGNENTGCGAALYILDGDAYLGVRCGDLAGSGYVESIPKIPTMNVLFDGTMRYVKLVIDFENAVIGLYIDGKTYTSGYSFTGTPSKSAIVQHIGMHTQGSLSPFSHMKGKQSDISFTCDGIEVAHYPAQEGSGNPLDTSGRGNDIITSTATWTKSNQIPSINMMNGFSMVNGAFETTWDYPEIYDSERVQKGGSEGGAMPTFEATVLDHYDTTSATTTDRSHSWTHSVKITKTTSAPSAGFRFTKSSGFDYLHVGSYEYSIWVYIPSETIATLITLYVETVSGIVYILDSTNLRDQWVNLSGTYNSSVPIKDVLKVKLSGDTGMGDIFYADDFSIKEISQLTVPINGLGYSGQIQWEDSDGNVVVEATDFDDDSIGAAHGIVTTLPYGGFTGHVCKIIGEFPRVYFNNNGDGSYITAVNNLGHVDWDTAMNGLQGSKISTFSMGDANISGISSFKSSFRSCLLLDTIVADNLIQSTCTDLEYTFSILPLLKILPVTGWDISSVTTMRNMLEGTTLNTTGVGGLDEMINHFNAQVGLHSTPVNIQCHFGLGTFSASALDSYLNLANTHGWNLQSGGYAAPELVINGDFTASSSWDISEPVTTSITFGQGVYNGTSTGGDIAQLIPTISSGVEYLVTFEITSISEGGILPNMGNGESGVFSSVGVHQLILIGKEPTKTVAFEAFGTTTATIDNISLKMITPATGGSVPDWVQPAGVVDAYNIGDEMMYNGIHYRSLIDANVWSPDAYGAGWEVV